MSEKQDRVRVSQVMAAAMAAVTAAVLGSTMGVAGTVVGAALASVVSSVGGAIYLRSIQRTKQGVRTVTEKVVARAGTTKLSIGGDSADQPATEDTKVEAKVEDTTVEDEGTADGETKTDDGARTAPPARRPFGWPAIVAGSVIAFVLGMLVITGVEWIKGESLSGGTGTTLGEVVHRGGTGNDQQNRDAPPATTSTTPSTETVTVPPSTEPTDPTAGSSTTTTTTTTTPPSSDSSAPSEPETPPHAP